MTTRSRSRDLDYRPAGYGHWLPDGSTIYTGYAGFLGNESSHDTTMAPPFNVDHDFEVTKKRIDSPIVLTGRNKFNQNVSYDGLNPAIGSYYPYLPSPEVTNWAYWETKALAGLNPSRPVVSVPLFVFEFKDFPEMLRSAGHAMKHGLSFGSLPEGYLNAHFGWVPFASDFMSLYNIAKSINDRARYLRRLEDGSHFKRTLFSGMVSTTSEVYAYGFTFDGYAYYADRRTVRYDKVWFTANAKAVSPLPRGTDVPSLSARMVLGLSANPASVWDFLPWSWLIDYFGNVGDFMQANVGLTQIAVTRMCIMHSQDYRCTDPGARSDLGLNFTPFSGFSTCKRRKVFVNPIPWLTSRPFLGPGQKLALASLLTAGALGASTRTVRN